MPIAHRRSFKSLQRRYESCLVANVWKGEGGNTCVCMHMAACVSKWVSQRWDECYILYWSLMQATGRWKKRLLFLIVISSIFQMKSEKDYEISWMCIKGAMPTINLMKLAAWIAFLSAFRLLRLPKWQRSSPKRPTALLLKHWALPLCLPLSMRCAHILLYCDPIIISRNSSVHFDSAGLACLPLVLIQGSTNSHSTSGGFICGFCLCNHNIGFNTFFTLGVSSTHLFRCVQYVIHCVLVGTGR